MPWRFFSAAAKNPRMVWVCQPVLSPICASVAPSGRRSIAITCDSLLPARGGRCRRDS